MRPVSTPWIVFDRDSRVDGELAFAAKAAMRAGVAFMSSPELPPQASPQVSPAPPAAIPSAASRLADINAMFPPSIPGQRVASTAQNNDEPSSLIVAADVVPTASSRHSFGDVAPTKKSRVGLIGATLGAVGVCSIAAYIVASLQMAPTPTAVTPPKTEAMSPAVAPPPEPARAAAEVAEVTAQAPTAAPAPAAAPAPPAEVVGENATDPNKRFGKLTIKGDATKKQVWFDGKRMLGNGNRSFLVFCGPHTVAVADKTAVKDTEVPCNGELTIDK